jgi:hypothetical protein
VICPAPVTAESSIGLRLRLLTISWFAVAVEAFRLMFDEKVDEDEGESRSQTVADSVGVVSN